VDLMARERPDVVKLEHGSLPLLETVSDTPGAGIGDDGYGAGTRGQGLGEPFGGGDPQQVSDGEQAGFAGQ
jgi:hypothetical protein